MNTQEIANRLCELCKAGEFSRAQDELYAPNITSTELDMKGNVVTKEGMDAIKEKSREFQSMVEQMHGGYCNEPKVFGKNIFMEMALDASMKGMGRMNMVEMCHYVVENGKIISERFYY